MTVREALGGPWATHWLIWVGLFLPTSLLVILREMATPFDEWWWPLVSAVVQHLAVGLVVVVGGELARLRYPLLPLWLLAVLWIVAAVVRGVAGGAIAAAATGVDPEYALRSASWLIGTVIWIPVVVYTVAQIDRRRLLLGALEVEQSLIEKQRVRADETGNEVRESLTLAVQQTLQPALEELVASLESSRGTMSARAVAELSMRVSQLHDRTSDLLEPSTAASPPHRPPRASVRRAFDVAPRQPWLIAALVVLATSGVMVPEVWRVFGELAALEVAVSTAAAGAVIGFVPWLVTTIAPARVEMEGQRFSAIACVIAILVATYLMLNSGIDPVTGNGLLIVPLLAMCLTLACVTYVAAIALAAVNDAAEAQLSELRGQGALERAEHDDLTERERRRLADLLHGPVQGRLAACVMALNFSTADGIGADQSHELVDSVLGHLRSVASDLSTIAASDPSSTP